MKISSLISNLRNSTKATVIACSVFLALTALILFFLMLFPIKIKDKSASLSAPVLETTSTTATTKMKQVVPQTTEAPHTLSTWGVSLETPAATTDPDAIPWYDALFTTTSSETGTGESDTETELQSETQAEIITEAEIIMTEPAVPEVIPVPETIAVTELVTEPPAQTVTEVVPQPEEMM